MKVLCDHCVPSSIVHKLRSLGHSILEARDVGLARASDEALFEFALRSKRLLITLDHDFGNITRFFIQKSHGVVVIYAAEMNRDEILNRIQYLFQTYFKHRNPQGTLFILEAHGVRFWPK